MRIIVCFALLFQLASAQAAGELVLGFEPEMSAPPSVLAATSDGGFLANVSGQIHKYSANGARFPSFNSVLQSSQFPITFIVSDGFGNWFVGSVAVLEGTAYSLVKLSASGGRVAEFPPIAATASQGAAGPIASIAIDNQGGCYVGGTFTALSSIQAQGLAHIDVSGRVTALVRPASLSIEPPTYLAEVRDDLLVVQETDAFILTTGGEARLLEQPPAGKWHRIESATYDSRFGIALTATYLVNGVADTRVFVWNSEGKFDPSFEQHVAFRSPFSVMRWDSAGRLVGINARIGGETNGITDDGTLWGAKRILRSGVLDPTWSRTLSFNLGQSAICELANGELLVAGVFTKAAGHDRQRIVKLRATSNETRRQAQQSCRARFEPGKTPPIMGVHVPNSGHTQDVLIRAVSGSLKKFGVTEVLTETEFSVYRGQSLVAKIKGNAPDAIPRFVATTVGAFPLDFEREAQAVLSLEPGAYTVVISCPFSESGEVLGEIYFAP